jgi:hypothetical protein
MKRFRLIAALSAVLLAAACGSATPSSNSANVGVSSRSTDAHDVGLVPADVSKVVVGWRLAPGGTPAQKVLTGAAADRLVRDFNLLPVSKRGAVPCPMRVSDNDLTVTFTAAGHTWRADVAVCPGIQVTRDGVRLPIRTPGHRFLADLETYAGHLPTFGPPKAPGGATPLLAQPAH